MTDSIKPKTWFSIDLNYSYYTEFGAVGSVYSTVKKHYTLAAVSLHAKLEKNQKLAVAFAGVICTENFTQCKKVSPVVAKIRKGRGKPQYAYTISGAIPDGTTVLFKLLNKKGSLPEGAIVMPGLYSRRYGGGPDAVSWNKLKDRVEGANSSLVDSEEMIAYQVLSHLNDQSSDAFSLYTQVRRLSIRPNKAPKRKRKTVHEQVRKMRL